MFTRSVTLLVVGCCGFAGCTSITSRLLERDAMNSKWAKPTHLKGIPITLKVPTHVKLYVFDVHFIAARTVAGQTEVVPVELDVPIRDFSSDFIYTEKIFTVDFKRPAGGSSNLRLDMSDDQYIQKLQHDITDTTIANVTGQLKELLPTGGLSAFKKRPKAVTASLAAKPAPSPIKTLVAVGVFEVDAPDFEVRMRDFLNCHINNSHDAWVTPSGVDGKREIKRVPVTGTAHPPLCVDGNCIEEVSTHSQYDSASSYGAPPARYGSLDGMRQ